MIKSEELTLLEKYQKIQELCKELEVKIVHTSCNIILEDDRGEYESFEDLSKKETYYKTQEDIKNILKHFTNRSTKG
jgi:hypothetical protein